MKALNPTITIIGSRLFRNKSLIYPSGSFSILLLILGLPPLQAYSKAQINLGLLYEEEETGEQNYEEAVKWYRLAAELGNTDA